MRFSFLVMTEPGRDGGYDRTKPNMEEGGQLFKLVGEQKEEVEGLFSSVLGLSK